MNRTATAAPFTRWAVELNPTAGDGGVRYDVLAATPEAAYGQVARAVGLTDRVADVFPNATAYGIVAGGTRARVMPADIAGAPGAFDPVTVHRYV